MASSGHERTWEGMLLKIALSHDTSMSRAMLRALGYPVPETYPQGAIARVDRYSGVPECFANDRRVRL